MKYAVIRLNGRQYRISEGEEILVDYLGGESIDPQVLLLVDDGKVKIGRPDVKGVSIKTRIVNEQEKGKKVTIMKFKAKSRYRKKMGFRPKYTRLLVEKIS